MGTVLGMIALFGRAGMKDFVEHFDNARVAAFREKCVMALDPEVDRAYPKRWIGKVTVETADGRTLQARADEPKGDPGNTLTRSELEQKALRLAEFSGGATPEEMSRIFTQIWNLARITKIQRFLNLESTDAVAQPPFLSVRSR
jgi:2-methylcitrate dehydratase PrpD